MKLREKIFVRSINRTVLRTVTSFTRFVQRIWKLVTKPRRRSKANLSAISLPPISRDHPLFGVDYGVIQWCSAGNFGGAPAFITCTGYVAINQGTSYAPANRPNSSHSGETVVDATITLRTVRLPLFFRVPPI